jgi:uncharacterized membrane protein
MLDILVYVEKNLRVSERFTEFYILEREAKVERYPEALMLGEER